MSNSGPQIEIPFVGRWHYSRAEMIADGIVHAVGIVLAIAAGSAFLALAAFHAGPGEYIAAAFYVVALLTVLSVSLAYNLWPVSSPAKWILRRFDHAAIYLLIAATYTPFLAQLDGSPLAVSMIVLVWTAAVVGIAIKVLFPGRFDRLAIVFYLAIGWSGIVLVGPFVQTLPATSIALIVAGGIVYSLGVIFFAWKGLRFHNAVWHGFVVTGAGLHLAAMVDCLVINRF
ncbi:hemolysin III family protein [Mesorhizobium sp. M4B.F.Ca.ET.215.01.1.1]|uniref:PAQR family membrane homeostasis protein TrhA n=1 Tax=unclassified Mesorhizobium TaxID=325217 RepID=UPI000FCA2E8C|nr:MULTISPECIES: hemolysin III family protein [unclassified Mesorhizobium]RUW23803.1 hemolysin III family protein [Mesorhizobium sp. M4B.F.Ca.ET.013.02.1.1]RVD40454.1 hemolysin III family protein [Mesorhizobium sp. M4B.F.Ca.ET.019.03.1.1]RWF64389.1 MAG: hemolysin III family protein [Mesorhizobium sp.]TGQ07049.1 hemolysin III family protein [Mesorhizobium sp. M4B.F.Ca.ET.215.01.1.1]TGQ27904.1 hemolysin III family protein [Mesorhizobium sp. M4B.F.Ca.ET.214.01.1.1]